MPSLPPPLPLPRRSSAACSSVGDTPSADCGEPAGAALPGARALRSRTSFCARRPSPCGVSQCAQLRMQHACTCLPSLHGHVPGATAPQAPGTSLGGRTRGLTETQSLADSCSRIASLACSTQGVRRAYRPCTSGMPPEGLWQPGAAHAHHTHHEIADTAPHTAHAEH